MCALQVKLLGTLYRELRKIRNSDMLCVMRELDASTAGRTFGQLIDEVRISGEPVTVTRYGRPMVVISPAVTRVVLDDTQAGDDTPQALPGSRVVLVATWQNYVAYWWDTSPLKHSGRKELQTQMKMADVTSPRQVE